MASLEKPAPVDQASAHPGSEAAAAAEPVSVAAAASAGQAVGEQPTPTRPAVADQAPATSEAPEAPPTSEPPVTSEAPEAPEAQGSPEAHGSPEPSKSPEPPATTTPATPASSAIPEPLPSAAALLAAGAPPAGPGGTVYPDISPSPLPAPPKDRRVLRAVARWVAAVGVFAVVGAGAAYGVIGMERTDVPGLATESDGRWVYPEISRAPVPEKGSTDGHLADVRRLVLPAPAGATEDKALRGTDGWLATKDFLAIYSEADDREEAAQILTDNGLRHIAARGWTTEDGTRTGIYLLQFDTAPTATGVCSEFTDFISPTYDTRGADLWDFDDTYSSEADIPGIERHAYDEVKPYGAEHLRQAYLCAGDVFAVIVQGRKGSAAAVPFQQTVVLQSQLLS
ncbi:hypothetical protein [Streptomyces sp. Amel2xC10]|uniref:hypothetical protein n=1 Tax=Streptomyces sp. Amel2xC10 TaxID=1305826 RepID=UPI000A08FF26|nr:hypothetical protein [Streptomyces sp. Amel2xC10]SMF69103.1 hypothetical protein SAMN02745830_05318 [Streptomyces sp. Amel2xC10]